MADCGGYLALTCFEHSFAYNSGTARNISTEFYMFMYKDLDGGYLYIK